MIENLLRLAGILSPILIAALGYFVSRMNKSIDGLNETIIKLSDTVNKLTETVIRNDERLKNVEGNCAMRYNEYQKGRKE